VHHSKLLKTIMALFTAAAIAVVFIAPVASAEDDSSEPVKTKAAKRRGTGEDENIISGAAENDLEKKVAPPKDKGGEATRGSCLLVVDNWTTWVINIYVDGAYAGTVSSWGQADGWFESGRRTLYAVAPFRNAADLVWGPTKVNCQGSHTWQLHD